MLSYPCLKGIKSDIDICKQNHEIRELDEERRRERQALLIKHKGPGSDILGKTNCSKLGKFGKA